MAKQSLVKNILPLPRRSLHRLSDLAEQGLLASGQNAHDLEQLTQRYAIAVTPTMLDQIDRTDPLNDPVARQFIPHTDELLIRPEEDTDPIGDYVHTPLKALVHRHPDRVLLKPTLACAVYCRFCFRREMIGPHGDKVTHEDIEQALDYIAAHTEIKEVILTGGDPLILSPVRLQSIMTRLHTIPHIDWIRIHTRVPVVQPDKITAELLTAMQGVKPVTIAQHINHARELSDSATAVLKQLHLAGHLLVSQSVLLRGINDDVDALAELFTTLLKHRVKPYYLHHADLAGGTGHFRVSLKTGMHLMRALRSRVSGLALPSYVLDIPGGIAKIPVNGDYVQEVNGRPGHYQLTAPDGQIYFYYDSAAI